MGGTPEHRLEQGKSMRKEWERLSITDPCSPAPLRRVRSKISGLRMSLKEEGGSGGEGVFNFVFSSHYSALLLMDNALN